MGSRAQHTHKIIRLFIGLSSLREYYAEMLVALVRELSQKVSEKGAGRRKQKGTDG